jgi:pimeloyl-ACP methyl ester carboxylesterase
VRIVLFPAIFASHSLTIRLLTQTPLCSIAVLTDAVFVPVPLNLDRFPGTPLLATAHIGFQLAHERTATKILATVKRIIAEKGATKVTSVGHSLGGALALLEGLHLRLNLPAGIDVITRTFGQPRVGFVVLVDWT